MDDLLANDVRDLNLSYLILAQRLLSNDRNMAMVQLGVDREAADLIGRLGASELRELAKCPHLLCRFDIQHAEQLHRILNSPQASHLSALHACLVMASDAEIGATHA